MTVGQLDNRMLRGKRVFMTATLVVLLLFLVSLVNFALAGGRMGLRDTARWDEVAPWPFIPVPAIVLIAAGVAATIGALMAVPHFRHDTADDLVLMGGVSIIVFGALSLFFAGVYTSTAGISTGFDSYPQEGLGWHWIAAVVQIPALLALAIRGVILFRARPKPAPAPEDVDTGR